MKRLFLVCAVVLLVGTAPQAAKTMTKCQQLQSDLRALADYHEALAHGDGATPEVEASLLGVAVDERALADGACQ